MSSILSPAQISSLELVMEFQRMKVSQIDDAVKFIVTRAESITWARWYALKSMLDWNLRRAG